MRLGMNPDSTSIALALAECAARGDMRGLTALIAADDTDWADVSWGLAALAGYLAGHLATARGEDIETLLAAVRAGAITEGE